MDSKVRILPVRNPISTRSRHYPTWTKDSGRNHRRDEPFDPHELYRRLENYQEQLIRAEKRRRAQIEKDMIKQLEKGTQKASQTPKAPPSSRTPQAPQAPRSSRTPQDPKAVQFQQAPQADLPPQPYKYIPKTAAASFVNTATSTYVDDQHIHPLSRLIARSPRADQQTFGDANILHRLEQKDVGVQMAIARADRNQFQLTPEMHAAAEIDAIRGVYKPTQRDFELSFFSKKEKNKSENKTPALIQELALVEEAAEVHLTTKSGHKTPQVVYQANDRNDWAQRDEVEEYERHSKRRLFKALRRNKQPPPANTPAEPSKGARRKSFLQIF